MADFFQNSPSFVNPSYATPEQLANARSYADALTKRSGENVNRPAGAAANVVDAITAALLRNNANTTQQQAAQGNSQDYSTLIGQLQNGQKPDPQVIGHLAANPMASPEARAWATKLISPEATTSVYGQPAYASPAAGVQAAPIQGNFQPGYRVNQGAEGVHTDAPMPAPGVSPAGPRMAAPPPGVSPGGPPLPTPQAGSGGGVPQAGAGSPAAPPAAANQPLTLDALAAKGREFAAQKAFTQGPADAQAAIVKGDIDAAATAPTIKRVAGVMLDDLQRNGDKMTFGPTAAWSNDIKRAAANYAPGLMKDQLETLASADSFDKMQAQLTGLLSKGGGTDAQLFNNMHSVPGSHNSREGAEALLKMTLQVADQQQGLRQFTAQAQNAPQYEAMRNDFYKRNPIINPLTNNPIALDVQNTKQASAGGYEKTATNPQTGAKLGLRNGQWEPIK